MQTSRLNSMQVIWKKTLHRNKLFAIIVVLYTAIQNDESGQELYLHGFAGLLDSYPSRFN